MSKAGVPDVGFGGCPIDARRQPERLSGRPRNPGTAERRDGYRLYPRKGRTHRERWRLLAQSDTQGCLRRVVAWANVDGVVAGKRGPDGKAS